MYHNVYFKHILQTYNSNYTELNLKLKNLKILIYLLPGKPSAASENFQQVIYYRYIFQVEWPIFNFIIVIQKL